MDKRIWLRGVVWLPAIFLAAWGLISPMGFRAAVLNNAWSIAFMRHFYDPAASPVVVNPPSSHAHAPLFLAIEAIQKGGNDQALLYLQPLIDSGDPIALDTYAQILFNQEKYPEALMIWRNLGDEVTLERAANQLYESGHPDLVLLTFQHLFYLNPEFFASSLAFTLYAAGDYEQAASILHSSLATYPTSSERFAWGRYLGDIFTARQEYGQAERTYRDVLDENPQEYKTWRNLGFLYWQLKEYENALDCFRSMAQLDPQDAYPYMLIADTYEKSGNPEQAILAYQQALHINPQNSDARQAIERLSNPQ